MSHRLAAIETLVRNGLNSTAPAIALAIMHRGKVVLDRAWGVVDPASGEPVRPDTRFDLASVTKLFTVTAFLQQAARTPIPWLHWSHLAIRPNRSIQPRLPSATC
jgi:CubicO group peptidase (beta-lactamase class C family)